MKRRRKKRERKKERGKGEKREYKTGELPPKHLRLFLNAQKKIFPLEKTYYAILTWKQK